MIAVSIPRRRIAFTPGLTDVIKKKLVMDLWIARDFLHGKFPLPRLHEYMDLTRSTDAMLDDVVYF